MMNGGRIEALVYVNLQGESLTFSHTSVFCPQEVTGLTDVRSTLYTIHSVSTEVRRADSGYARPDDGQRLQLQCQEG